MNMNVKNSFILAVERFPDREAIVEDNRRYTYREWAQRIYRLANSLRDLGIAKGDRVAIGLKTREQSATAIMALQVIGAVAVPYNPRLKVSGLLYHLRDAGTKAIIFEETTAQIVREAVPQLTDIKMIPVCIDSDGGIEGTYNLEDLIKNGNPQEPDVPVAGSDLGIIVYTSGTTGEPKGVPLMQETMVARVYLPHINHGTFPQFHHRFLAALPFFHTIGFHYCFLSPVIYGGTCYIVPDFIPGIVLNLIAKENITNVFLTPTHWHMLLECPDFSREKVSSVRDALYAGASMNTTLTLRCVENITENFTHVYGNTETHGSLFYCRTGQKPGALKPTIGHAVRVVNIGGNINDLAKKGEQGELIINIRSPEAFSGYWNKPAETAKKIKRDWYFTGDAAYQDEEGDFFISGRVDDMIISGAENVYPEEIEEFLSQHPEVSDVAVIGVPDERWGQVVKAFIIPRSSTLTSEEIDRFCKESTAFDNWKRPRLIEFVDAIPRNPSGKIMRFTLR